MLEKAMNPVQCQKGIETLVSSDQGQHKRS